MIIEQSWGRKLVARDPAALETLRSVLRNPDEIFAAADTHWLKRGTSQSVIKLDRGGNALVVKRYNLRDF